MDILIHMIHGYWRYDFIDDELSPIPHRKKLTALCQVIKHDQYYESQVILDHDNPYYQKYNKLDYGIISHIGFDFTSNKGLCSKILFLARDLPPSQIEPLITGNNIETYGYILTGGAERVKVSFTYTFVVIKHIRILTGYQIKIPCDIMELFINTHLDRYAQEVGTKNLN